MSPRRAANPNTMAPSVQAAILAAVLAIGACSSGSGQGTTGALQTTGTTSTSGSLSATGGCPPGTPSPGTTGAGGLGRSATSGTSGGAPPCACPFVECRGACVDLRNDPYNCGQCGTWCPDNGCSARSACVEGTCASGTPCYATTGGVTGGGVTGSATGGTNGRCSGGAGTCCATNNDCQPGLSCEDLHFPGTTTGGCQTNRYCQACQPPNLLCNGRCVPSDAEHCGSCGNVCGPLQACVNGQCECKAADAGCGLTCQCALNQELCGTRCADTARDPENCGGCGKACAPGLVCLGRSCVLPDGGTP